MAPTDARSGHTNCVTTRISSSAPSATPQPGIFALGSRYQHHLEFDVDPAVSPDEIAAAISDLHEPTVTGGAANMVIGFGSQLWQRIGPRPQPVGIGPFVTVEGLDGMTAPATQHDIWIWIHGAGTDVVFDTASSVVASLEKLGRLVVDVSCFVYHDSRDLTGFIDGTANPAPVEAPAVACIPPGLPGAGGSHVIAQRWVHDLDRFNDLEVREQEDVFGRRKPDSVEIPDEIRRADAHISLAEIHDENGDEREVYRRSTPWGAAEEHGLYFLGFSAERDRFDVMLAQMFGTDGRQIRDRLLDFTAPVSGSFYFAPCIEDLIALGLGNDDDQN